MMMTACGGITYKATPHCAAGSKVSEIMIAPVVTIPQYATVLDAYEFFLLYKFLAFPVGMKKRPCLVWLI
jgi:CBS domain-containing protein